MDGNLLRLLLISFALTPQACAFVGGEGLHTEKELEREFSEMKAPLGATSSQHNSIFKTHHGVVGDYYKSSLTYKEIRAHYDEELQKRGWRFKKEVVLKSWGEDRGEIQAIYCKGDESADIYFTGQEESTLGYRYAFNLSWGLDQCR